MDRANFTNLPVHLGLPYYKFPHKNPKKTTEYFWRQALVFLQTAKFNI